MAVEIVDKAGQRDFKYWVKDKTGARLTFSIDEKGWEFFRVSDKQNLGSTINYTTTKRYNLYSQIEDIQIQRFNNYNDFVCRPDNFFEFVIWPVEQAWNIVVGAVNTVFLPSPYDYDLVVRVGGEKYRYELGPDGSDPFGLFALPMQISRANELADAFAILRKARPEIPKDPPTP